MLVYHGSTLEVKTPLVDYGRSNLDFGKGFYVTNILSQAESFAQRMARRKQTDACVNVYEWIASYDSFRYKKFLNYDEEWLDFIVANRNGLNLASQYDVVEGGVANDRVIDTIEAYIAGLMPKQFCLQRLAEHQPNNQICILSQEICDRYIRFVKSYKI
jgi:hypothetical protein